MGTPALMGQALHLATRIVREAPPLVLAAWSVSAVIVISFLGVLLLKERRAYARAGQPTAWLLLRLAWLPIVAAAAAGVGFAIPVKSGMESLAWFYILGATVGPLLYFGLHMLGAVLLGLRAKQGLAFAATGLLAVVVPATVAGPTQQAGWTAHMLWSRHEAASAPASPPGHVLASAQRLTLPGGEELWSQHWRASRELHRVESVEVPPYGANGSSMTQRFTSLSSWVCRDHEDLHVTWPASMKEAVLTVRWRDSAGSLRRSDLRVAPPRSAAVPLAAQWSAEGVTLPVRPPRLAAMAGTAGPGADLDYHSLAMWEAHESPEDFCLPRPYRSAHPLAGIALRLARPTAEPLRAEFARPPEPLDLTTPAKEPP